MTVSVLPADRAGAWCVAPGVWGCRVPYPGLLGYSLSYFARVRDGFVAIDLGWDCDAAWDAFVLGLRRAGGTLDDLRGAVVTHAHPDHVGLAARLRANTSAWIAAHPADAGGMLNTDEQRGVRVNAIDAWMSACGTPRSEESGIRADMAGLVEVMPRARFDVLLDHGDKVPDTDGALRVMHTPGHSPGHICLVDEQRRLVYTGDHVLPRVTPNVSKRPGSLDNPLAGYMASLQLIAQLDSDFLGLPGHEWSYEGVPERSQAILDHLSARDAEVLQVIAEDSLTAWEIAGRLRWAREFVSLDSRGRRQALGETLAHLTHLQARKMLRCTNDVPVKWFGP